jgi:hypothetical protein
LRLLKNFKFVVSACCYPFLGSHTKIKKNKKIYIRKESKKIIGVRKWCWNAHKIDRNWLRRFKNTRIEIWQYIFNWWSPVDKENSIWGRNVQNQMFMNSIKYYLRFNWIYGGFDCKKNLFLSQFRLLLKEIKVLGFNYNFKELIWLN